MPTTKDARQHCSLICDYFDASFRTLNITIPSNMKSARYNMIENVTCGLLEICSVVIILEGNANGCQSSSCERGALWYTPGAQADGLGGGAKSACWTGIGKSSECKRGESRGQHDLQEDMLMLSVLDLFAYILVEYTLHSDYA